MLLRRVLVYYVLFEEGKEGMRVLVLRTEYVSCN